jgi:tRNA dimethylallyltransferase
MNDADPGAPPAPGTSTVIVVGGPTASGKSALAIDLAERLDGVVVNADSMQVYRDLRILTARPSAEDEARVPHRLFGTLDAADICSAARWRDMAEAAIAEIHATGKRAIVVGGTGLYLRALMQGLADIPAIPDAVRAAARARHAGIGGAAFHAELAERDPAMAARLAPGDSQRLIRAREVLDATGRSLADWQAGAAAAPVAHRFDVVLLLPPRDALYAACDARLEAMIDAGALDEVAVLAARADAGAVPDDAPLLKALGMPELRAYLAGDLGRAAALAAAQQATRRFAKRQMTWFRHQLPEAATPPIERLVRIDEKYSFEIGVKIFSKIT